MTCRVTRILLVQAAEQAEALCYPANLHDLILFTLELPLIECIQDDKGTAPGLENLKFRSLWHRAAAHIRARCGSLGQTC
jgi:hypothetical protein